MERINLSEHFDKKTMMGHLLLSAMSSAAPSPGVLEHFHLDPNKPADGHWAEVRLTINGVECDLKSFAKNLEGQLDRMVEDEARKQIDNTTHSLTERVDNLMADLKAKMGLRECTCHLYD